MLCGAVSPLRAGQGLLRPERVEDAMEDAAAGGGSAAEASAGVADDYDAEPEEKRPSGGLCGRALFQPLARTGRVPLCGAASQWFGSCPAAWPRMLP